MRRRRRRPASTPFGVAPGADPGYGAVPEAGQGDPQQTPPQQPGPHQQGQPGQAPPHAHPHDHAGPQAGATPQPPPPDPPFVAEDAEVAEVEGRPVKREVMRAAERDITLLSDDEHLAEAAAERPDIPVPEAPEEEQAAEPDSLEALIDDLVSDEEEVLAEGAAEPATAPDPQPQAPGAGEGLEPDGAQPAPGSAHPQRPAQAAEPQPPAAFGRAEEAQPQAVPSPEPPALAEQPAPAPHTEAPPAEGIAPQLSGEPQAMPSPEPSAAAEQTGPQRPELDPHEELEPIEFAASDPAEEPAEAGDPGSGLEADEELWRHITADDFDSTDEELEPPRLDVDRMQGADEAGGPEQDADAEPKTRSVTAEEVEELMAPQQGIATLTPEQLQEMMAAQGEGVGGPAAEQAEAMAAAQQARPGVASQAAADASEEQERPYVAVRSAVLDGPNPLPLALDFDNDIDEINHALSAFSDLQFGQMGFIRFSLRAYPELKQDAREWLAARRTGVEPVPSDAKSKLFAWVRYGFRRLWFEMMRKPDDKTPPPLKPGQRGDKVKPASEFTTEEKESWKAAERKARDTAHFEVAMRIAVVGPQEEAERQVEEVAAGFEVFATPFQAITWRPGDPYAALLGLMGARQPEELPMALCAEEIAGMAHVPDDQTAPHAVIVKRSHFKQLLPPNPIVVEDKMNPQDGIIPIGEINPGSEDARVVGMYNAQLDQHAVIVGKTGSGKALALDTPIPTPQGLRRMGDLRVGDHVFGVDGRPTRIVGATEVMEGRPCYEVVFSDGERIVADANHLWVTRDAATRRSDSQLGARRRTALPKWLSAVEKLAEGEGLVSQRDAIDAGVPYHAVRDVARHIPPAGIEMRVAEQSYGGTVVTERARLLPLYERAELCRALRRRAFGARRRHLEHRRQPQERTTAELAASVRAPDGRVNHSVDLPQPLQYPERKLPVAPYTLGAWLGDGRSRHGQIATADEEVLEAIRAEGYEVRPAGEQAGKARAYTVLGLKAGLRELGLLRPEAIKRIPEEYFTASEAQRWALLEGLLDTGGGVERGACRFHDTSRELTEDVRRLAFGLGLRPKLSAKPARLDGRTAGRSYTLTFTCSRPLFRVARKRAAQDTAPHVQPRYIVEVNPVSSVPVRCIQVAAEDGMFLAGRTCVPTHNSVFLTWMGFGVAKADYPIVVVDPHGQLSDDILNILLVNCPERVEDIVYCDLSDDQYPVAFNPLDVANRTQITPTVNSVSEMLAGLMNLDASSAPRATLFAKQALTALCFANLALEDPNTKCTLLDVQTFFSNPEFRRLVVEFCDNESVRQNFDPDHGVFEVQGDKEKAGISMPIIRAFSQLGSDDSFSAVFQSPRNKLDLGRLIGQGKIVIIKLARYSHQAQLGEFVGALVLPWMLSSMDDWGRHKDPITGEQKGRGVRVFVDEAPALYGPESSVPKVLAEARKWDLGLISIGQNLGQFPKNVAEALLANTASKFALASDPNVSAQIAKAVAGASNLITPADVAQLPNYHMYCNILLPAPGGGLSASGPFSVRCLPPMEDKLTNEHLRLRDQVIARSREIVTNDIREIRARARTRTNDIMVALNQRLAERIDSEFNPSDGISDGGQAGIDPDGGWY